jgi:hypothetical protein
VPEANAPARNLWTRPAPMNDLKAPFLRMQEPLSLKNNRRFTEARCLVMTKSLINAHRIYRLPGNPWLESLILTSSQPNRCVPCLRSNPISGTTCPGRRKANH